MTWELCSFPQFFCRIFPHKKEVYLSGSFLAAFFSESCFFSLSRLSFAALGVLVFFLGLGFTREVFIRSKNR